MSVGFRPLGARLLVQRLEEQEERTAGGIIIPDTAKEKPNQGRVVAVGSGHRKEDGSREPLEVKVGDTILFQKWGGNEVKINGTEYLIMKEDDVLGLVEG